jgi:hypothetical protein
VSILAPAGKRGLLVRRRSQLPGAQRCEKVCILCQPCLVTQWQEAEAVCASAGRQPPLPLTTCHKTITHRAGAARSVARWDKHKRRCIEDVQRHFCVVMPFFFCGCQALLPILTPTPTHLADTQHTRAHHAHTQHATRRRGLVLPQQLQDPRGVRAHSCLTHTTITNTTHFSTV